MGDRLLYFTGFLKNRESLNWTSLFRENGEIKPVTDEYKLSTPADQQNAVFYGRKGATTP